MIAGTVSVLGRAPQWFSHSDHLDVAVKRIATKVQEIKTQIANGKRNVVRRMCVREPVLMRVPCEIGRLTPGTAAQPKRKLL